MSNPYLTNEPTDESLPPWDINPNHFNQSIFYRETYDTMEDESQPHGSLRMNNSLDLPQHCPIQKDGDFGLSRFNYPGYSLPIGQYPPHVGLAPAIPQQMVQNPTPPTLGTEITGDSGSNTCAHANCGKHFPSRAKLNDHARKEKHCAFRCHCGSAFTRSDALTRHAKGHSPERSVQIRCHLCVTHKPDQVFNRRDNLRQHLEVWHRLEGSWLDHHTALEVDTALEANNAPLLPVL